jgi:VIT1/CCC1 family predicted Fe2+/Mn2+ transporter
MGKKKHNKHPGEGTQAEEEHPTGHEHHNNLDLRDAVAHAFSSGWVQNSGVLFAASVIALIVAVVFSSQIKTAAISFALAGTFFLWILAAVTIKYAAQEKGELVVTVKGNILDTSRSEEH